MDESGPLDLGEHAALLSALIRDGRAPLAALAESCGASRQTVWRNMRNLQSDTIWGYTGVVDAATVGWRAYRIGFAFSRVPQKTPQVLESAHAAMERYGDVHIEGVHVMGNEPWLIEADVMAKTRSSLQGYLDLMAKKLGPSLSRADVREVEFTWKKMGHQNPQPGALADVVQRLRRIYE